MKLLVGFVTSVLVAATLSLGFAAPAQAKCDNYGPCLDTRLSAWSTKNPIKPRRRAPFAARLKAENGASPNAHLYIRVKRRSNGNVVWRGSRFYDGGRETYRTGRLPRGRFRVHVRAVPNRDRFENARAIFGQRVRR